MVSPVQPVKSFPSFVDQFQNTTTLVVKIALEALLIGASIYAAWAYAPLSFQAVAVVASAIASVAIAAYLFTEPLNLPSTEAPQGIFNDGNNCAFNSAIQFCEADPVLAQRLRTSSSAYREVLAAPERGSQPLRLALPSIPQEGQVDVGQVLTPLIEGDSFPVETSRIVGGEVRKSQTALEPVIHLGLEGEHPKFRDMFHHYLHRHEGDIEETNQFLSPPRALRFQFNRFRTVGGAKAGASPEPYQAFKQGVPIDVPPQLALPLADGSNRRYRLVSFIQHHGDLDHGHYTAGRIVDGTPYLIDDDKVTQVTEVEWTEATRNAYFLCYLPI